MKIYKIEIKETMQKVLEVSAENVREALKKVNNDYACGRITLNPEDRTERDITDITGKVFYEEHFLPGIYRTTQMQRIDNPSGIIVVDVESTGLNTEEDEILQLSIIDGDGKELMNEYLKPYVKTSWKEAQAIHRISPSDVEDCPYAHEIFPKLKSIIASAHTYIGYNSQYDIEMLQNLGVDVSGLTVIDVMKDFAPIYGEYNEYYGTYKWQKLSVCAKYYGYEFRAHDSLEDVRATLYCYKKMQESKRDEAIWGDPESEDKRNENAEGEENLDPAMRPRKKKKM